MNRFIATAAVFAGLSACNLGIVPPVGGFADGSGTPSDGSGSAINFDACQMSNPAPTGIGNHNQGMACITTACHDAANLGVGAPAFIIGGTVYADETGTSPAGNATVYVTEGGMTHTLVTSTDGSGAGNFYVMAEGSATTMSGSGSAEVTLCPSVQMMANTLNKPTSSSSNNDGNCNRSGCHGIGGQDGGQPPIHL
jgi:hypothetical protein